MLYTVTLLHRWQLLKIGLARCSERATTQDNVRKNVRSHIGRDRLSNHVWNIGHKIGIKKLSAFAHFEQQTQPWEHLTAVFDAVWIHLYTPEVKEWTKQWNSTGESISKKFSGIFWIGIAAKQVQSATPSNIFIKSTFLVTYVEVSKCRRRKILYIFQYIFQYINHMKSDHVDTHKQSDGIKSQILSGWLASPKELILRLSKTVRNYNYSTHYR